MMTTPPLVSVVMIFLNAERYMEEAIASVRAQTYDNWELLLCDDGSSDGSTALARRHAEADPSRIRYLEHPGHQNRGMSATRNLGFHQARGQYLALLDADDVYLPHKLESQLELLARYPQVAMVYSPTLKWFSWDPRAGEADRMQRFAPDLTNRVVEPVELVHRWVRREGTTPGTCSLLVRAEAARQVGFFETSFRGLYEDQVFGSKICLRWPVYVSGEICSWYRQHAQSACHQAKARGQEIREAAYRRFLIWLGRHAEQLGMHGTPLWRQIRRALWRSRYPTLHGIYQAMRQARRQVGARPVRFVGEAT